MSKQPQLIERLRGANCAVVTMECQRGVIGDLATFPALKKCVDLTGLIGSLERLADSARTANVPVVHCTVEFRTDHRGSPTNAPLLLSASRIDDQLEVGSPQAELIAELGPKMPDLISSRRHGVSPFIGTNLDATLRSLDVDTIVACGVSLNVGLFGLCVEAVNLGYHVLLPRDGSVGVPVNYGEELLTHSLSQLAVLCTVDSLADAWEALAGDE